MSPKLIEKVVKHLQDAELYKAVATLRNIYKSEGFTKDLLSCLYFSYHLFYLMAKHQNKGAAKYKRLRDFYLFKLTKEKAEYNVFLDLYLFFKENFRTFQRFVWFDKNKLQEQLLTKVEKAGAVSKETKFYKFLFLEKYNECVNLLLEEDFDDEFIRAFLSKQTISSGKEENIEKLRLLEHKYFPEDSNYFLFIHLYSECDEYEKLYALFNKFPSLKDPSKVMYVNYGNICLNLSKYNEALSFFESQRSEKLSHLKIGECYEAVGNTEQAICAYQKAMKHFSSGFWQAAPDALIRLKAFDDLDAELNDKEGKWHKYNPEFSIYYKGLVSYYKGKYKESIKQLDDAVKPLEEGSQKRPDKWYYYQALNNYEITLSWMDKKYQLILENQDYNMTSFGGFGYPNFTSYHDFGKNMKQLNLKTNHKYEEEIETLERELWKKYASYWEKLYKLAKQEGVSLTTEQELNYLSFFESEKEVKRKIEVLKEQVQKETRNASKHLELGRALLKNKKFKVAERHFKKSLELADKYFVDLHGSPELLLIELGEQRGQSSIVGNNQLFEQSMRNYISHGSYRKSVRTMFMDSILYKYCSFSLNTISSLSNQYLFFSESQKFNDPFDVNAHLINDLFDDVSVDEALFKSYSLAQEKDSLLMWAHYAEEHYGICIGYKFEYLPSTIGKGEIIYKETLLKEKEAFSAIEEYWLTKGNDWAYEKEIRLLHFGENNEIPYCFDKKEATSKKKIILIIEEVIVGLNFKEKNKSILRTLIKEFEKKQGRKIKILKAEKDNEHPLKLTIKEYSL